MTNPSAISRKDMIKLNQVYGESIYTEGNDVDLIVDGNDLMDSMIADIRAAEKNVYAEFFIIKNDRIGKRFIRELKDAAQRGVTVKLLIDRGADPNAKYEQTGETIRDRIKKQFQTKIDRNQLNDQEKQALFT